MNFNPNMDRQITRGELYAESTDAFSPIPFSIDVDGRINGTEISIRGSGHIPKVGVYKCVLNFDRLPPNFHPSAIATYVVSICCVATAVERNGGRNFRNMGASGYATKRVLTFPEGQIIIEGDVSFARVASFKGGINGDANIVQHLAGNSIYIKRLDPVSTNVISGVGEGSIHTVNGGEVPVTIETLHTLRPVELSNPFKQTQFRIVTECGALVGRTYTTEVHSILDGANTMGALLEKRCSLVA